MRYPEAIWEPGPPENVYAGKNACDGVILHSAEGRWSDTYRPADTMRQSAVSWQFTVEQTGAVLQHYDLDSICWHAGTANRSKVGVEHEGRKGEPLTPLQLKASIRLVQWIGAQKGWKPEYRKTIFPHFDFSATTCPNSRIPWDLYVQGEDVDVRIVSDQSEAIQKLMRGVMQASPAIGRQDGRYIGVVDAGEYEDIVIRTRKGQ